jgi:FAD/FMN-containing dehydrogenase
MTSKSVTGMILWRDDAGYEDARGSNMWNRCVPPRYPQVIARPRSDDDVVSAVRLARQRGLKIAIRSGGHRWAASFLRDGGMLIDLSELRNLTIDVHEHKASLQPGLRGTHFASMTCSFHPDIA